MRAAGTRAAAFWGLLALAFVAPVAGMVLTLHTVPDEVDALSPPAGPVVIEARQVEANGEHPATGTLTWAAGPTVVAPAWSGLVTAVMVVPGQQVSTGTVLARIDGTDRIAVASPQPFHRQLAGGDRGPDVVMLRGVLGELGYPVGAATGQDRQAVDQTMVQALRRLEADLSHIPAGQAAGVFRPEWFGWLPVATLTVHQVALGVSTPAPPAGQAIVTGPPALTALKVTVGEEVQLDPAERYEFAVANVAVPLTEGLTADGAAAAPLAAAIGPGTAEADGRIRMTGPRSAIVVPIGAVQTNPDGGQCVLRVVDGTYQPTSVVVTGGDVGTAEIASGVAAGEQVLANPLEAGVACD